MGQHDSCNWPSWLINDDELIHSHQLMMKIIGYNHFHWDNYGKFMAKFDLMVNMLLSWPPFFFWYPQKSDKPIDWIWRFRREMGGRHQNDPKIGIFVIFFPGKPMVLGSLALGKHGKPPISGVGYRPGAGWKCFSLGFDRPTEGKVTGHHFPKENMGLSENVGYIPNEIAI